MNKQTKKEEIIAKANLWREQKRGSSNPQKTNEFFGIARQMKESKQEIIGGKYLKDDDVIMQIEESKIMDRWREYFEQLLSEEKQFDNDEIQKVEGPLEEVGNEESSKTNWINEQFA